MRQRVLVSGGLVAGWILIAFGAVSIVLGIKGHSEVGNNLKAEQIVGTPLT